MPEPLIALRQAASVAVIDGDRVLLIKRARAPFRHLWTLPGGKLDPGETLEACAIREVAEELDLHIGSLQPVLVERLMDGGGWELSVFTTATFSGNPVPSDEIAGLRWCTIAESETMDTTDGLPDILRQAFGLVA